MVELVGGTKDALHPENPDDEGLRAIGGRVSDALRRGDTVRVEAVKGGAKGPHTLRVTPNAAPPWSQTLKIAADAAPDPASEKQRWPVWARLQAEFQQQNPPTPADKPPQQPHVDTGASPPPQSGGMRLDMLPDEPGGVYVVYQATGTGPEGVISDLEIAAHNAGQNRQHIDAGKLNRAVGALKRNGSAGVGVRAVAVGVGDPAALDRAADEVASTVFPPTAGEVWKPVRDQDKRIIPYTSPDDALADVKPTDPNIYATGDQVAADIRLPRQDLPGGWTVRLRYGLPKNQELPPGVPTVSIASTLSDGIPTGRLELTPQERRAHFVINAGTGVGKTHLIRALVAADAKEGRLGKLVIDAGKTGRYARPVADMLKAEGVNVPVYHIDVGAPDAPAVVFSPFQFPGMKPSEAMSTGIDALAQRIPRAEGVELFTTTMRQIGNRALHDLGTKPSGGSRFRYGVELYPHGDHIRSITGDVVSGQLKNTEYGSDVKGWFAGKMGTSFEGLAGGFINGDGSPFDYSRMAGRLICLDLGRMGDADGQRVAAAIAVRGTYAQLELNASQGAPTEQDVIVDEGYSLVSDTPLGAKIAGHAKLGREYRLRLGIAGQGGLERLHPDFTDNAPVRWFGQNNNPGDQKRVGELAGPEYGTAAAHYVANVPYRIPGKEELGATGQFLYMGPSTPNGPMPVFVDGLNPNVVEGAGEVRPPSDLLINDRYRKPYTPTVIEQAKDRLLTTWHGDQLYTFAGIDTANILLGHRTPGEKGGEFLAEMQGLLKENPDLLDCMVDIATDEAARGRAVGQDAAPVKVYRDYVRNYIDAQIKGGELPPPWPAGRTLDIGYYNPVLDRARAAMLAPRLPGPYLKEILGATANQQRTELVASQFDSREELAASLPEAAKLAQPSGVWTAYATEHMAKLAGGKPIPEVAQELQQRLQRPFTDKEEAVFGEIALRAVAGSMDAFGRQVERLERPTLGEHEPFTPPPVAETGPPWEVWRIGYPAMLRAVDATIAEHADADAPPLDDLEREYPERFPRFRKAHELVAHFERKQKERNNMQRARTGEEATPATVLFAPDFLRGGLVVDNFVAKATDRENPKHPLAAVAGGEHGADGSSNTFAKLIKTGDDTQSGRWSTKLGNRLLLSNPDYQLPPVVALDYVQIVEDGVREARNAEAARRATLRQTMSTMFAQTAKKAGEE